MSLQGLPGASPALRAFVRMVREYLRDTGEVNRLIKGEESSDRQIAWAVADAVSNFNGTPHFTRYTLEELLSLEQTHLLTRMTTISLLESVALLQTRNHIDYATGGTRVSINNKAPLLMQWVELFKATTEQKVTRAKVALNIGAMLGSSPSGVHSEYWAVNQSYATYR